MSNNEAIVNCFESYLDDLVDSFQDFIQKSLLLITIGIGSLIGLLLYFIKSCNRENLTGLNTLDALDTPTTITSSNRSNTTVSNEYNDEKNELINKGENTIRNRCCSSACGKSSASMLTKLLSTTKKETNNMGVACPPSCISRFRGSSNPRITLPSLPSCPSTPCVMPNITRSCCSLCCEQT
ncbi:uncharacterized protein LOC128673605 [Plodia interpunctella]|uniref:uncharacterized protein LOC128673605 n=1 Tax=Plodia interpunctella TaxID=58824 RepID=UPI002367B535|nr:uncharacterized protein LOC128673605 [Plodia interpunctella]